MHQIILHAFTYGGCKKAQYASTPGYNGTLGYHVVHQMGNVFIHSDYYLHVYKLRENTIMRNAFAVIPTTQQNSHSFDIKGNYKRIKVLLKSFYKNGFYFLIFMDAILTW